jgi:negative regulator of flagellin synthesis FlgM
MSEVQKSSATPRTPGVVYDFAKAQPIEPQPAAAPVPDSISLTSEAKERARVQKAVEAAPEVRQERVDELRQQIEDGTYNPDPREVAKSIMKRGL